ncbi:hypothetical protein QVD17_18612 [Tagetes erecta]|uniref:Glutaredoxin domain-containing protein n=1 Tax=Tagetes erecta TaxID=13708 RepID=A0AAD8KI55_TARER|nr:hypothetical protein QVD17_18612 [Tagetes erecta]
MSYSSLPNHTPPRNEHDHHVVALTSTTLGHLLLDPSTKSNQFHRDTSLAQLVPRNVSYKNSEEFEVGVIEGKTWSKMINEKINKVVPKTPVVTPPGEPEAINSWELMEGLEDSSPLQPPSSTVKMIEGLVEYSSPLQPPSTMKMTKGLVDSSPPQPPSTMGHTQCSSLNNNPNSIPLDYRPTCTLPSDSNSKDTAIASSFDPNKIHIQPLIKEEQHARNSLQDTCSKKKLILYFTSLRGVRKTYEDCCQVRTILKNFGARVVERDVSMHSGFKEELKELLGDGYNGGGLPKPLGKDE